MSKTKPQSLFFTAITAFITVYGMTLYNTVLAYFFKPFCERVCV